jgi:hypothetical protein
LLCPALSIPFSAPRHTAREGQATIRTNTFQTAPLPLWDVPLEPCGSTYYLLSMAFPLTVVQTVSTMASPAQVWRAFEAVEQWPTVMAALASARLEPAGILAVGSVIVTRAVPGSNGSDRDYRVLSAEPPHRLTVAVEDAGYRAVTRYEVAARTAEETDIVASSTLDAVGLMQSLRFLAWRARIVPVLKANTRERAQGLADLAERLAAR